ncbi:MAG: flagellar assembly protein FliW [Thermodesulfobacteriota bacterium]|nr:flagellar assembly protein FliW [Thermodesulfobacteriota bacterium]
MKIDTRKFGTIEIDSNKILTMPECLPGFPGFTRFALLEDPKSAPFCWFQSTEDPSLALVIMSPFLFKPDYRFNLDNVINARNWSGVKEENLIIYVVVNISEREEKKNSITANLLGPLVINSENNEAVQVVLSDTNYSHQHNVLDGA